MNLESSQSPEDDFLATDRVGYDLLNDPLLNKGTGFTDRERELFELHGLLPPTVATLDEQVSRRLQAFRQLSDDFQRYLFLRGLQDTNEVLFYALLVRHISKRCCRSSTLRRWASDANTSAKVFASLAVFF